MLTLTFNTNFYHISVVTSSQPVHCHGDSGSGESVDAGHAVSVESFTQPSRFDELIVGTQIPCTPGASQVRYCIQLLNLVKDNLLPCNRK